MSYLDSKLFDDLPSEIGKTKAVRNIACGHAIRLLPLARCFPIIDESCSSASSDVRIRTRAANDECPDPRSEHRISRNDQTVVLFGIDGGQSTRSPISVRLGIPRVRTRPMVGECEPPWRWNQSPIAAPERRSRETDKAA